LRQPELVGYAQLMGLSEVFLGFLYCNADVLLHPGKNQPGICRSYGCFWFAQLVHWIWMAWASFLK